MVDNILVIKCSSMINNYDYNKRYIIYCSLSQRSRSSLGHASPYMYLSTNQQQMAVIQNPIRVKYLFTISWVSTCNRKRRNLKSNEVVHETYRYHQPKYSQSFAKRNIRINKNEIKILLNAFCSLFCFQTEIKLLCLRIWGWNEKYYINRFRVIRSSLSYRCRKSKIARSMK